MIEWKRDGEYVIEGTDVKAEYLGCSEDGGLYFVIDGLVCAAHPDGKVYAFGKKWRLKHIVEKPKTYTVTIYVYKSEDGSEWASDSMLNGSKPIGKHTITAPYGTGL